MGCPELAYSHCLHYSRGRADWNLILRATDKYLTGTAGRKALEKLVERAQAEDAAVVSLVRRDFSGFSTPSVSDDAPAWLRFNWHAMVDWSQPWVNLIDPARVSLCTTHYCFERFGSHTIPHTLVQDTWINHYID